MNPLKSFLRRLRRAAMLLGSVSLLLPSVVGEEIHAKNPYDLMAGYLHRFPAYVQWPNSTATSNTTPWRIGVLGDDPFGESLIFATKDMPVAGREFQIIHATRAEDLRTCELVYIGLKGDDKVKAALTTLAGRPILTVGAEENFLELGGVVRMEIPRRSGSVRYSVNLDQAKAVNLKVRVEMLENATQILQDGRLRKTQ
jgi:hypothetical protein